MRVLEFMRSMPGRILRVAVGLTLLWFGATQATLLGLVLMMMGLIPVVTAALNVCLIDEIAREVVRQRNARAERMREQHV